MMEQFPVFGVVTDFSDHSFATSTSNLHAAATNAVMKEWKILQKNLPAGSIYVRAYEGRVDLLRAAIVGAQKTPYHDGLFFFDFQFPPNYPDAPPKTCYRSFGLRLNPNLYHNGAVCLSVLNTWPGPKESGWQPGVSTMLQVLVSIQGLVLNDAPLYNEPNLIMWMGSTSSQYNETAFVLSCKTMVYLLERPPRNFQRLVTRHFRARARAILAASQAYLNGFAPVGDYEYGGDGHFTSEKQRIRVRSIFESLMKEEYATLLKVFSKYDSSLIEFSKELELMVDNAVKDSLPPPTSKVQIFFGTIHQWMEGILGMALERIILGAHSYPKRVRVRNIRFWDILED